MMKVNKLLTPYNYSAGSADRIEYAVIHYVGATGGAEANCKWYAEAKRGASAHYYVGFNGEIWQSVEDHNIAWHCGASSYVHPNCRNSNSIGIELCVRVKPNGSKNATSKDWYFEDATIASGIALTKEIMQKYNIPADRVIRHYDVTGKICPNPFVYNHTNHTWADFKSSLTSVPVIEKKSGWKEEDGGWRFYNGDTGKRIENDWYHDVAKDQWYWFDGSGMMLTNKWYKYKGNWFFLGADGIMCTSQLVADNGKIYAVNKNGEMITDPIILSPGEDGALEYPGLANN